MQPVRGSLLQREPAPAYKGSDAIRRTTNAASASCAGPAPCGRQATGETENDANSETLIGNHNPPLSRRPDTLRKDGCR